MKKFLDKLKNALPFGKKNISDEDIEASIDDYEENFHEDDSTDPDLDLPGQAAKTQEDIAPLSEQTLPDVIEDSTLDEDEGSDTEILPPEEHDQTQEQDIDELQFSGQIPDEISTSEDTADEELNLDDLEDEPNQSEDQPEQIAARVEDTDQEDDESFDEKTHWRDRGTATEIPTLPQDEVDEEILSQDSPKPSIFAKLKGIFNRKKKQKPVYYDEDLNFQELTPKKDKKRSSSSTSSLSFLGFFHWLFSAESRPKIHRYFLLIIFFIFFFSIGKIVGLFVSGNEVPKIAAPAPIDFKNSTITRQQFNAFSRQDIFDAKQVVVKTEEKTPQQINREEVCLKADGKTSLPYYLINTIVLQNSKKSLAAVKVRQNPELLELREGQEIESKARIDRIGRLRAVIKNFNTGACEYMENSDAKAPPKNIGVLSKSESNAKKQQLAEIQGIQNDGNSTIIERDFMNKQLANISNILTQALAIPVNNPDGTVAFRITDIEPGSIYSYLNIQNGDTITEINGKKIQTQNEVLNLFGKLKTIKKLQLTVKRGGAPTQLDYTFK